VIGFDDIDMNRAFRTELTTVRQRSDELGRLAVRTLTSLIANPSCHRCRNGQTLTWSFEPRADVFPSRNGQMGRLTERRSVRTWLVQESSQCRFDHAVRYE
jgi:hypothetical protein